MMKLLDYFYSDYIADLALVENSEFQEQSIKFILKHDNLSEARVKELNDDRLINFSFSTNIFGFFCLRSFIFSKTICGKGLSAIA